MARLVSDICKSASLLINATQLGADLTPDESSMILTAWQQLIDNYGLERANIHTIRQDTYTLTAGQQSYTIGPSGQWNSTRPVDIVRMKLVLQAGVYTEIISNDVDQFADIQFTQVTGVPYRFYYDSDAPLGKVYLYPVPTVGYSVVVYTPQALEPVLNLTDTVLFAQGYERFWTTALALEIAPLFGLEPSPTLVANAADAKANVQGNNRRSPRMINEPLLLSNRVRRFDWRSGGMNY